MRSHAPLRFVLGSHVVRFALGAGLSLAASGCLETTAQTGKEDKSGIREVPSPSGGQGSTGSGAGEGGGEAGSGGGAAGTGGGGTGGAGGSGGQGGA
jgi:hypothetical protein